MIKKIGLFVIFLGIISSSLLLAKLKDDISISLEEKQVQHLSPDGLTLVFYINLVNSSSKTYYLSGYSYRFVVTEKEYIRLKTPLDGGLKLEASKKTLIALPVKITYNLLFDTISELRQKSIAPCYIMGEMTISDGRRDRGRLPFAFSGELPIFKVPEIKLIALKSKALTIGGADIDFVVKIRNQNGFEILTDDLSYEIKFGGHPVKKGRITQDMKINENEEKEIVIPLLLNFFDVGRDVYAILLQSSVNCDFAGNMELSTLWGRLILPFALQIKAPIIRTN